MTLAPGTKLGPYQIDAPIGAGGMGEVYRATDPRIPRAVAIKVLPAPVADDPTRRARFEREARTIGSLNHPNICTLFDVGRLRPEGATASQGEEVDFLVMELVEGETLATRLQRGSIAIEDALRYAIEIASALDRAHRHGIVHRDLKPANVMITKSGVKLLDFGLAKFKPGPVHHESALPTRPADGTAEGTILGTLQYMSPEQVEGREADARSDVFALGAVLYEMVTGRRAFEGKSQASLIGAILRDQPAAIATLHPLAPATLDRVVRTCLQKDPDNRWQSAADLGRELRWVAEESRLGKSDLVASRSDSSAAGAARALRRERTLWAAGALVASTLVGTAVWRLNSGSEHFVGQSVHATVLLGDDTYSPPSESGPANAVVSPDGRFIAYPRGGSAPLVLRAIDEATPRPIPGTEGAQSPFFSPDSQWLGLETGGILKRVSLGGGAPVNIVSLGSNIRGASWGDDGWVYYAKAQSSGLWRVRVEGGTPESLTTLGPDEKSHRWPFVLPGSQAVLFVVGTSRITSFDDARIEALSLADGKRHRLVDGGTFPQFVPTGHLVYTRGGALFAVAFDPDRLARTGSPTQVLQGTFQDPLFGTGHYSFSRDGTLVYVTGGTTNVPQPLLAVDRTGSEEPLRAEPAMYTKGRVSPDGTRLVVGRSEAAAQLYLVDLIRGPATQMTPGFDNSSPVWSPDESRVAFSSNRAGGAHNLWVLSVGSTSEPEQLTKNVHEQIPGSWSPNGSLAFADQDPETGWDIWVMEPDDHTDRGKPRQFLATRANEGAPAFSPDGKWMAFQSDLSTRPEVYVQAYQQGARAQSIGGGTQPLWRSAHEIIYRNGPSVMSVPVMTSPTLHAGSAVKLFDSPNVLVDLLPGGRFLMRPRSVTPAISQFSLIVNWFDELRRKTRTPVAR